MVRPIGTLCCCYWPTKGSAANPYKINVSLDYPKFNGIFNINYMPWVLKGDKLHNIILIRVSVPWGDKKKWKAYVPLILPAHLSQYKGQVVFIEGPSCDLFFCHHHNYLQNLAAGWQSDNLRNTLSMSHVAIKDNKTERSKSAYMLIFKGLKLHNSIFSPNQEVSVTQTDVMF